MRVRLRTGLRKEAPEELPTRIVLIQIRNCCIRAWARAVVRMFTTAGAARSTRSLKSAGVTGCAAHTPDPTSADAISKLPISLLTISFSTLVLSVERDRTPLSLKSAFQ
jgi:hypothetical protein